MLRNFYRISISMFAVLLLEFWLVTLPSLFGLKHGKLAVDGLCTNQKAKEDLRIYLSATMDLQVENIN